MSKQNRKPRSRTAKSGANARGASKPTKRNHAKSNSRKNLAFAGVKSKLPNTPAGPRTKVGVHENICALVNPFCNAAKGAKWPDGLGGDTLTYQIRGRYTTGTFSDGGNLLAFIPGLPYAVLGATNTAGTYAFGSAMGDIASSSAFTSTIWDRYRIVTCGLIFRSMLPAMTAQGIVTIGKLSSIELFGTTRAAGSTIGNEVTTHGIRAGLEIPVVAKPIGSVARNFTVANTATHTNAGWEAIFIEILGGPASASNVFSIEWVVNVEFTLNSASTSLHQMIKPNIPNAPKTIEAASVAMDRIQTTAMQSLEDFGSHVLDHVAGAAEDVLVGAMAFLGL